MAPADHLSVLGCGLGGREAGPAPFSGTPWGLPAVCDQPLGSVHSVLCLLLTSPAPSRFLTVPMAPHLPTQPRVQVRAHCPPLATGLWCHLARTAWSSRHSPRMQQWQPLEHSWASSRQAPPLPRAGPEGGLQEGGRAPTTARAASSHQAPPSWGPLVWSSGPSGTPPGSSIVSLEAFARCLFISLPILGFWSCHLAAGLPLASRPVPGRFRMAQSTGRGPQRAGTSSPRH